MMPPHTSRTPPAGSTRAAAWSLAWQKLSPRERAGVLVAVTVVGAGLLWAGWIAPAVTTLRQAPAQHAQLDAQLQTMQSLAEQARQMAGQPMLNRDDSLRALEQATSRHFGNPGALKVTGDQASVTLPVTPAATVGNWLADVRSNARLSPVNARLTQTAPPPAAAWQGSVTFALPR